MQEQLPASDAAEALVEIRRSQEQVLDASLVPVWYWWLVAVVMVGLAAAVDSGQPFVIAIGVPVCAISIASISIWMVLGAYHHVQVGSDLLGHRGALAIVGFVWLVVGVTLGLAFAFAATNVPHPATLACLVGGAAMVVIGPLLMGVLRRMMLANRAGTR